MTDNFIQLKEGNALKLNIKSADGKDTGEFLEFEIGDIELPLKYQELCERDKKCRDKLRNQLFIIDKRQDVKGKKLMSKNQEDKIRAMVDFFKEEVEIYNAFLGPNGVNKLLHGRKLSWDSLDEIDEIIDKQIVPRLDVKVEHIADKIRAKYGVPQDKKEEIEVLE